MESSIVEKWVSESPPDQKEFRQAVQTILLAITLEPLLKDLMIMKGGILLAIKYQSGRFTKDIDFSSSRTLDDIKQQDFEETFGKALRKSVIELNLGLDCMLQKIEINPPSNKNPTFPSYSIKVGYAVFGTPKHKRLQQKLSPSIVKIDFSLNELILNKTQFDVDAEHFLHSYDVNDLIAEKIRSLIQQVDRNRYRRQDVFDIHILLRETMVDKAKVLESIKLKSESRNIIVNRKSLDNPEVRKRALAEYSTLDDEIDEELPDFDIIFDELLEFYKSLPWEDS